MRMRKKLACSFCGRTAAEVSKLVAGPRVFICDACVTEAARIMNDPNSGNAARPEPRPRPWQRLRSWLDSRIRLERSVPLPATRALREL